MGCRRDDHSILPLSGECGLDTEDLVQENLAELIEIRLLKEIHRILEFSSLKTPLKCR
jgi:hypothetical protein